MSYNNITINAKFLFFLCADSPVAESVVAYLKAHEDVFPEIEGRIMFVESDEQSTSPRMTTTTTGSSIIVHTCPDTRINAGSVAYLDLVTRLSVLMSCFFLIRMIF